MPSIGEVLRVLDGDGIDYLVEGPALSENVEWLIPNVQYPPASMSRGECNADGLAASVLQRRKLFWRNASGLCGGSWDTMHLGI